MSRSSGQSVNFCGRKTLWDDCFHISEYSLPTWKFAPFHFARFQNRLALRRFPCSEVVVEEAAIRPGAPG